MLNGIAPILIFSFAPEVTQTLFSGLAGIPVLGDILPSIGIPIPVYLDERLTGVYVESESKAMDIDTVVQLRYDGKKPSVDQRGVNNLVTVNLIASKNSVMLSVLLALSDIIFSKLVAKTYTVSYLNGATTVFGGLLHGFSVTSGANDDLMRITMQISKANENTPTAPNITSALPKITGALPVGVAQ